MSPRHPTFPMLSSSLRAIPIAVATSCCALALGACSSDAIGVAEENVTDSFAQPTEHGEMVFGMPNMASFDASHRFHAWTFVLGAEASIEIVTELKTMNLDTIMYMYSRPLGAAEWGSYVAKNDDHADTLASRIAGTYGAGEYRIVVKGAKINLQGHFAVNGSCDGAGCPAPPGGECSVATPAVLPAATDFTASCPAKLQNVLLAPVQSSLSSGVLYSQRCDHGALIGNAIDFYREYWDAIMGWGEFTYGDADPSLDIGATFHGDAGAVVYVSAGGDEDTLRFVFGPGNQLLMHYHDEQSSTAEYYCGEAGEAAAQEPDIECIGQSIVYGPHRLEKEEHIEGAASLSEDEPFADYYYLLPVLRDFVTTYGLADTDVVSYAADYWDVPWGDVLGSTVEFSLGATTATYFIGDEDYGNFTNIFTRTDGAATMFVCTGEGP